MTEMTPSQGTPFDRACVHVTIEQQRLQAAVAEYTAALLTGIAKDIDHWHYVVLSRTEAVLDALAEQAIHLRNAAGLNAPPRGSRRS